VIFSRKEGQNQLWLPDFIGDGFGWRSQWLLVVALLVGVLIYFLSHGPLRFKAFKTAMIARGEILDLKKLTGNHAPANENAASQLDASMNALGSINFNSVSAFSPMKLVGPGRARISWKQTEQMGMDKKKNSYVFCVFGCGCSSRVGNVFGKHR